MVTRVRIEAEGASPADVEATLYAAAGLMTRGSRVKVAGSTVHASMSERDIAMDVAFGSDDQALVDMQAGEMVIERFAKDLDGEPNHGAVFWRGRMTTHYAPRTPTLDLRQPER